ncbi:MAG: PAS domain S-box protein [bacterium]|nr:PAS domain S-box protein [bacterium]MBU1917169.1 PAS domain S-box protein [bacterium]
MPKILIICSIERKDSGLFDFLKNQDYNLVFITADSEKNVATLDSVDLILCDINRLDKNPFECLAKIKEHFPQKTPVMMTFGETDNPSQLIIQSIDAGCADFINLPINQASFLNRVQSSLFKSYRANIRLSEDKLELFRHLIDESNDALFVIEPETSHFLDCNKKACDNLGYTRKEILQLGVINIEGALPKLELWQEHVNAVKKNGSMFLLGRHIRKNGTSFPVEVSIRYIETKDKNYIVASVRNVDELKEYTIDAT